MSNELSGKGKYWLVNYPLNGDNNTARIFDEYLQRDIKEIRTKDKLVVCDRGEIRGIYRVVKKGIVGDERFYIEIELETAAEPIEPIELKKLKPCLQLFNETIDLEKDIIEISYLDYNIIERELREKLNELINVLSEDYIDEFYEKVEEIAWALSNKYWQVSVFYPPEDVIQEVILRVARRGIKYDPSKSILSTFCYMLVNSTYINLSKSKTVVYGGQQLSFDYESERSRDLVEVLEDRGSFEFEDEIALNDVIERLPDTDRVVHTEQGPISPSVRGVIKLKSLGYTNKQISSMLEMRNIGKVVEQGRELLLNEGYC